MTRFLMVVLTVLVIGDSVHGQTKTDADNAKAKMVAAYPAAEDAYFDVLSAEDDNKSTGALANKTYYDNVDHWTKVMTTKHKATVLSLLQDGDDLRADALMKDDVVDTYLSANDARAIGDDYYSKGQWALAISEYQVAEGRYTGLKAKASVDRFESSTSKYEEALLIMNAYPPPPPPKGDCQSNGCLRNDD